MMEAIKMKNAFVAWISQRTSEAATSVVRRTPDFVVMVAKTQDMGRIQRGHGKELLMA